MRERPLSSSERWLFVLFALLGYSVLGYGAWRGYFFSDYAGGDFRWYYHFGAWMIRRGLDIYSPAQIDLAAEILGYRPYFPFFHMPSFFLVFVPFTYLPALVSESLWFLLSHLFIAVAFVMVVRRIELGRLESFLFAGLALFWKPLFAGLACGQVLLLVLLLLVITIARLSEREGGIVEGFLLAFVVLLKIQFLPLLILLAFLRRWRVLAWTVVGVMGFVLLGMSVYGWDWWILSLQKMSLHTVMQAQRYSDPSLWMTVRRFFQATAETRPILNAPHLVDPTAFSIAALFWIGWLFSGWRRRRDRADFHLLLSEFGFFALTMIITHPVNVYYSFTVVILLFPEIINRVRSKGVSVPVKALLFTALLCMNFHWAVFIHVMPESIRPLPGWIADPAWMGAVLLWGIFWISRVRECPQEPVSS